MAKKKQKKSKTRSRTRRRGRSRVGALGAGAGVSMETLGAVIVGGVASKATNGIVKNVQFMADKKWAMPALKVAGGYFMTTQKSPFLQGMGAGVILEGFFHGLEALAPNVFQKLQGEKVEGIGYTLIDLDDMPGASAMRGYGKGGSLGAASMESEQGVAGLYAEDAGVV